MSREPMPGAALDREERELAALLARDLPSSGPSPALDAAILSAARKAATDAGGVSSRPTRRPRLAWAASAGLAASLVLAVGVAWQIRPQGDMILVVDEAPVSVGGARPTMSPPPSPPPPAADASLQAPVAMADRVGSAAAEDTRPNAEAAPQRAVSQAEAKPHAPANAPRDAPSAMPAQAAAVEPPPVMFDAPQAMDAAAPPRRDADPQPAIEQTAAKARALAGDDAADVARQRAAGTRPHAAAPPADDAHGFDQPLDDAPPASADAPEVRDAWLARIRELVAEERYTEARESFDEFRRRYPAIPVPRDLRVLLP